jgi:type IV conjugative transfer system coupling protein TraD
LQLLVTGEFSDLEPYLVGTPASTLMSNKIEKTAISIRAVLTTYLKSLQSLDGLDKSGKAVFSIRDYLLNEESKGWLFITSNGDMHKSLKPLISMWITMASLTILSLTEDFDRRIWVFFDEVPSLHRIPSLIETIAEARKFGGCFLLGTQSSSQLEMVYGHAGAHSILSMLNTRAFFAVPDPHNAELSSKELCEEEIDDTRENYSYGANSIRDGISLGKNRVMRRLVIASEVMMLRSMSCFLRLPDGFPITKLNLALQKREKIAEGFIPRILPIVSKQTNNFEPSTQIHESSSSRFESKAFPSSKNKKQEFDMESIF